MKKEKSEMFECEWCGHEFQIDLIRYEYVTELENKLSETEEKLKRVYKEVLEDIYYDYTCPEYGGVTELCRYCEEEKGHKHDTDCIVLEAQTWLEDKE